MSFILIDKFVLFSKDIKRKIELKGDGSGLVGDGEIDVGKIFSFS